MFRGCTYPVTLINLKNPWALNQNNNSKHSGSLPQRLWGVSQFLAIETFITLITLIIRIIWVLPRITRLISSFWNRGTQMPQMRLLFFVMSVGLRTFLLCPLKFTQSYVRCPIACLRAFSVKSNVCTWDSSVKSNVCTRDSSVKSNVCTRDSSVKANVCAQASSLSIPISVLVSTLNTLNCLIITLLT